MLGRKVSNVKDLQLMAHDLLRGNTDMHGGCSHQFNAAVHAMWCSMALNLLPINYSLHVTVWLMIRQPCQALRTAICRKHSHLMANLMQCS